MRYRCCLACAQYQPKCCESGPYYGLLCDLVFPVFLVPCSKKHVTDAAPPYLPTSPPSSQERLWKACARLKPSLCPLFRLSPHRKDFVEKLKEVSDTGLVAIRRGSVLPEPAKVLIRKGGVLFVRIEALFRASWESRYCEVRKVVFFLFCVAYSLRVNALCCFSPMAFACALYVNSPWLKVTCMCTSAHRTDVRAPSASSCQYAILPRRENPHSSDATISLCWPRFRR